MRTISENTTIADIYQKNPLAYRVFETLGIASAISESQTISQVSETEGFHIETLLNALKSLEPIDDNAKQSFYDMPLPKLIAHLENEHNYLLNVLIPDIENCLNLHCGSENSTFCTQLRELFFSLKAEISEHIIKETEEVMPYILALCNGSAKHFKTRIEKSVAIDYAFAEYFDQMRHLTFNFDKGTVRSLHQRRLYLKLLELENLICAHEDVEDEILLPRALELEIISGLN